MDIQSALDSAVKGFNDSYEEGLRQGKLEMDSLKFKYETAITAMRIKDKKYDTLNGQYKALEKSHENLLDTLRKVARGSCLKQINTENKCICYPCISQNAISKAEGDL